MLYICLYKNYCMFICIIFGFIYVPVFCDIFCLYLIFYIIVLFKYSMFLLYVFNAFFVSCIIYVYFV